MGQDLSTAFVPPPTSFQQCFIDGEFSLPRYIVFKRNRDIEDQRFKMMMDFFSRKKKRKFEDIIGDDISISESSSSSTRSVKKHKLLVRSDDGTIRALTPTDTLWYLLYVKTPPQDNRLKSLFRTRFRVPYSYFIELSNEIYENDIFSRWRNTDATGQPPSNMKLLLLGSLRYLGRSWTFDDISESNGISREVNRKFFICLIEYGSTVLFKKHVIDVARSMDMSVHEKLFAIAGMNGCAGSSDATNIMMLNCPSWASNSHKGFKLNLPARTYNLTVSHTKLILCSTTGHPSTWNDKTVVLYDPLISSVHDGLLHNDFEFKLFEKRSNGDIVEVIYKGLWFMVDNGYLNWSCTVPPVKDATTYETIRFSEWLESMRKDVECTFGILKQRFSVLRNGIRLSSIKHVDQVWLTCCALHNKLLIIDGLHENWNNSLPQNSNESFATTRLNRSMNNITYSNVKSTCPTLFDDFTINGKRIVSKMPLSLFRQCLINHFDIRFKMNSIYWPSNKSCTPTTI